MHTEGMLVLVIYSLYTALQTVYAINYIIYSHNDIFLFYFSGVSTQIYTNLNKLDLSF